MPRGERATRSPPESAGLLRIVKFKPKKEKFQFAGFRANSSQKAEEEDYYSEESVEV